MAKWIEEHPEYSRNILMELAQSRGDWGLRQRKATCTFIKARRDPLLEGIPRAISGGVGEVFGTRLGNMIGIPCAPVTLSRARPGEEAFITHHVKEIPGGWSMSERIKKAIPLYFLSGQVDTWPKAGGLERVYRTAFERVYNKRCPIGRDSYADFPDQAPRAALEAARWDSPQRLLQYAFRLFLYCSFPHASNALVDVEGKLYLIDFDKMCLAGYDVASLEDIELLHEMLADCEPALEACRHVASITQAQIVEALSGIEENFWQPRKLARRTAPRFSDERAATEYFLKRLTRWKKHFGEKEIDHAEYSQEAKASSAARLS